MMTPRIASLLVLLGAGVLSLASCSSTGGTETDNPATPLKDFASSGCKNRQEPGQLALVAASDIEGLQCVEWETPEAGSVTLHLHNFAEPCGETYLGKATFAEDGALELVAYKDTCAVYKCGLCLFDFEFRLEGVEASQPLPLRLGNAACDSEPPSFPDADALTLPLDTEPSGIVCRYLAEGALNFYATEHGSCGERNMPCGDCGLDETSCAAGQTCTAVSSQSDMRCLLDCSSDDDCTDGLTTCQDGACQAPSQW